jgi:hypothetical protein
VAFPSEAFDIEGTLSDFASEADSGNVMHRRFCPKCGTHVFAQSEARPHLMSVRAGTLDGPEIGKTFAHHLDRANAELGPNRSPHFAR